MNVLWAAAHEFLLEFAHRVTDRGFDFALCPHLGYLWLVRRGICA
jgi:hypothetical protein